MKKSTVLLGVVAVLGGILIFTMVLLAAYAVSFSGDLSEWENREIAQVDIVRTSPDIGSVDLGKVAPPEDGDWSGETYEGFNDKKQRAMAKELLKIYNDVVEKDGLSIQNLGSKDKAIEFLLGYTVVESSTYSGAKGAPTRTYIPKTMVSWEEYGEPVRGKKMSFTNFNWEDFLVQYKEDPNGYYKGFRNKTRSPTGAVGPFQFQPAGTWSSDPRYVKHRKSNGGVDEITDIENYVKSSSGSGRSYIEGEAPDIFNYRDQAYSALNWINNVSSGNGDTAINYYDLTTENEYYNLAVAYGSYHSGGPGFIRALSGNYDINRKSDVTDKNKVAAKEVLDGVVKLMKDEELFKACFSKYKSKFSHGVEDRALIREAYQDLGWKMEEREKIEGGKKKRIMYYVINTSAGEVSIRSQHLLYPVRAYFEGKSWYMFLQGIAYGKAGSSESNYQEGIGKVTYNYMNKENGYKINTDGKVRTEATKKDRLLAIGYKGPFPIYDQSKTNKVWNSHYGFSKPYSRNACTIFMLNSIMNGVGAPTGKVAEFDGIVQKFAPFSKGGDGYMNVMEMWVGYNSKVLKRSINDPRKRGYSSVGLLTAMKNMGYETQSYHQGTKEGNEAIIKLLSEGNAYHIRTFTPTSGYNTVGSWKDKNKYKAVKNGRVPIVGLKPKGDWKQLDYKTFDMYDLSNYETTPKPITYIPYTEHSFVGVDAKEINGRWYISIVNSTGHHGGVDTNLVWWDAYDLLNNGTTRDKKTGTPVNGNAMRSYRNGGALIGHSDAGWIPNASDVPITGKGNSNEYKGEDPMTTLARVDGIKIVDPTPEDAKVRLQKEGGSDIKVKLEGDFKSYKVKDTLIVDTARNDAEGYTDVLEFRAMRNPKENRGKSGKNFTHIFDLGAGETVLVRSIRIYDNGTKEYNRIEDIGETD